MRNIKENEDDSLRYLAPCNFVVDSLSRCPYCLYHHGSDDDEDSTLFRNVGLRLWNTDREVPGGSFLHTRRRENQK
jgi:hypothetical protein